MAESDNLLRALKQVLKLRGMRYAEAFGKVGLQMGVIG